MLFIIYTNLCLTNIAAFMTQNLLLRLLNNEKLRGYLTSFFENIGSGQKHSIFCKLSKLITQKL